jgi:SAM-dependent methyltransferase
MKRAAWIILALVVAIGWLIRAPDLSEGAPSLDVPYEPTTHPIVEEMLDMAAVTSNDVVYDLGCGDGRIVITAAKKRGAKGVGVDLDPARIKESRQNAKSEGVTDKVVFYEQNLFETDLSPATVVMLYLWPDVNLRLRPKLISELRPGTRIVSNTHTMDEWESDSLRSVMGQKLYFFVIPANVTGLWNWVDHEGRPMSLSMDQKFQEVKGVMTAGSETNRIRSCSLEGNKLSFIVERSIEGKKRMFLYKGQVSGDSLEGTVAYEGGDRAGNPWKADRNPTSKIPIAK